MTTKEFKTVGELIDFLQTLDRDAQLIYLDYNYDQLFDSWEMQYAHRDDLMVCNDEDRKTIRDDNALLLVLRR